MIKVEVDTTEAERYLMWLGKEEQLPFAMSKAINSVVKLIQDAIRGDMQAKLHFTQMAFELRAIKINKFSNKNDLVAEIGIEPKATNLYRLQTGQDHIPFQGKQFYPIANSVVFNGRPIRNTDPLFIRNLHLTDTPGGAAKGLQKTFIPKTQEGKAPIVVQRIASGKGVKQPKGQRGKKGLDKELGTRILYTLVRKGKTPVKMNFYGIASQIITQSLGSEIAKAVRNAVATAR
jgi:hypothetical protein